MALAVNPAPAASSSLDAQRKQNFQVSKSCNLEIISQIVKRFIGSQEKNKETKALRTATNEHEKLIRQFDELGEQLKQDVEEINGIKASIDKMQTEDKDNNYIGELVCKVGTTITNLSVPGAALAVFLGGPSALIIPAFTYAAGTVTLDSFSSSKEPPSKKGRIEELPSEAEEKGPNFSIMERDWFFTCQNLTQILEGEKTEDSKKEEGAIRALLFDILDNENTVRNLRKVCETTHRILTNCQEDRDKVLEELNEHSAGNMAYKVINGLIVKVSVFLPKPSDMLDKGKDVLASVLASASNALGGSKTSPLIERNQTQNLKKRSGSDI